MKRILTVMLILFAAAVALAEGIPEDAQQICLVAFTGNAQADFSFMERTEEGWRQVFSCPAYVGVNGINKQKEGDKKTPTGVFELDMAFGILPDPGALMPYHQVNSTEYWISNVNSSYYNKLIDVSVTLYRPQNCDEYIIKTKDYYNYCLNISYNKECTPGKGSAIFLHCMGKKTTTSGCIAIPEEYMVTLLQNLREGGKIVIDTKEEIEKLGIIKDS